MLAKTAKTVNLAKMAKFRQGEEMIRANKLNELKGP